MDDGVVVLGLYGDLSTASYKPITCVGNMRKVIKMDLFNTREITFN